MNSFHNSNDQTNEFPEFYGMDSNLSNNILRQVVMKLKNALTLIIESFAYQIFYSSVVGSDIFGDTDVHRGKQIFVGW